MYRLILHQGTYDENVEIMFQSIQQVLDFISLLNLSLNTDLWIQLSYDMK